MSMWIELSKLCIKTGRNILTEYQLMALKDIELQNLKPDHMFWLVN